MPHVVTQSCCSDASCVYACPVNCIHPTPDEPDFLTAEMLHIDPQACVDCGACVSACPVDAIVPQSKLTPGRERYLSINADFYAEPRPRHLLARPIPAPNMRQDLGGLRVAIVGSGPSAMYAADELLTQQNVTVNVFDRLPTPHGLVRAGVAPDHQKTKQVSRLFDIIADQKGFEYFLNVEVGTDISHADLLDYHHAVIYAVGASSDRRLGITGEDLPGCASATDFVAWYNGHPDHAGDHFDLSTKRVVIVGNGNVALDAARILTMPPADLAHTDIATHALEALRESKVEEVVILARRGAAQSAFTVPEFAGLLATPGIDVIIEGAGDLDTVAEQARAAGTLDFATEHKFSLIRDAQSRPVTPGNRRVVIRYLRSPAEISGDGKVERISLDVNVFDETGSRVRPTGEVETIDTGLVLTSIGYKGVPLPDLPFDETRGVLPNVGGRVTGTPRTYAVGWIKRGPTGFIGTNKSCSQETVNALVDDFNAELLHTPPRSGSALRGWLRNRVPAMVTRSGWNAIDLAERRQGEREGRVRTKLVDRDDMVAIADQHPRRARRIPTPAQLSETARRVAATLANAASPR